MVIWDAEDVQSDVFLMAGLSIVRAICTQQIKDREGSEVDFESAEKAIRAIEKLVTGLDELKKHGQSIQSSSDKILNRVRIMKNELQWQIDILDGVMEDIESILNPDSGS